MKFLVGMPTFPAGLRAGCRSTGEGRVMVTKDADFTNSFLLCGQPLCLLIISTGNLSNHDPPALFARHIAGVEAAFDSHDFVELDHARLTVRP